MFHILLDTEVFQAANLDFGSNQFSRLVDRVNAKEVVVYVADVTVGEIRAAIAKRVHQAVDLLKPRETRRILGVLAQSEEANLAGVILRLDEHSLTLELTKKFEALLKELNAQVLTTDNVSVAELRDRYFGVTPPFGHKDNKKCEFPDALAILAAEAHAERQDIMLHVVSNDAGIAAATATAKGMQHVDSLKAIIDQALKSSDATAGLAELAQEVVEALSEEINTLARERFEESGFYVEDDSGEVVDVTVDDVDIGEPAVAEVAGDLLTLEFLAEIQFTAEVEVADPSQTAYDSEAGESYVFGHLKAAVHKTQQVEGDVVIRVRRSDLSKSEILSFSLFGTSVGIQFPWDNRY